MVEQFQTSTVTSARNIGVKTASQPLAGSLIAIGPSVLASGEVLGTSGATWKLHLHEPFLLGGLGDLSASGEEFNSIPRGDRYLLVEAHNVGRVIAAPSSWEREHGKLIVALATEPPLKREDASKLNPV